MRRQRFKVRNSDLSMHGSPFMDFQQFVTYDRGVATNPSQLPLIHEKGDFVGMQPGCALGRCDPRYPSDVPYLWFSVGNWCPNLPFEEKGGRASPNPQCLTGPGGGYLAGGLCPGGRDDDNVVPVAEPTGQPGCAYSYGRSELVRLDEVAGIGGEDCGGRSCHHWMDFRWNCTNPDLRRRFDPRTGQITDVECPQIPLGTPRYP